MPSSNGSSRGDEEPRKIALNPVVASIKPSKTVEIFSLVKQMEADGEEVTSFCVGEPDFYPPKVVLDTACSAMMGGETRYTALMGTIQLRTAIARDLKRRKNLEYDPKTEIVVGNGAKQSIYQGVLATCGAGDKAIVPAPFWPSYPEMVTLAGGEPIILETRAQDGYLIRPDDLKKTLEENEDVKLLIVCNPSNPTGGVHDLERLKELAAVLQEYPDVAILADEVYERFSYNGDSTSFASLPGMFHRTLTINGFSKTYAMTGFRLGYLAAPAPLARAVATIQSQLTSCAGSVSQAAAVVALNDVPDSELDANIEVLKGKREYVLGELKRMPFVEVLVPPTGAFYVFPDVSHYFGGDDEKLCIELLKSQKLALVPGSSFGAPGTVRISYTTSMEQLVIGMGKLRRFLDALNESAGSKTSL